MKRPAKRKRTGLINLATLRRLARRVYGKGACVEEIKGPIQIGDEDNAPFGWGIRAGLGAATRHAWASHEDRGTARRMLKAALEAGARS